METESQENKIVKTDGEDKPAPAEQAPQAAETETSQLPWRAEYAKLQGFVSEHETIRITPTSMRIPKEFREEFYAQMDKVEVQLAKDLAGERLEQTRDIAGRLSAVRSRVMERGGLRAYVLPSTIENMVADPYLAASRPIMPIVMDALQMGLTPEEMENRASQLLMPFIRDLSRCAYELWAYLTVIDAWKPVKFYGIATNDTIHNVLAETDGVIVGHQVTHPERRLPETVLLTEDGRYIGIKTEVGMELFSYGVKKTKEKGYSSNGNTENEVAHRVLLAYRFPSLDAFDALADAAKNFVRPTSLMCTFLLPGEMESMYQMTSFAERLRTVRSLKPVQLITMDEKGELPDGMTADPTVPKIQRSCVGYNEEILREIAARI